MSYLLAQASAHRIPLRAESVQCVVTSPPYWGLRAYAGEQEIVGWGCALGLEPTPELYVEHMVEVFREVRRVLRSDGTLWLNLGDSYAANGVTGGGSPVDKRTDGRQSYEGDKVRGREPEMRRAKDIGLKPKDLVGIPWRVAFALQADGWYLRSDIIWAKPNPMPESVTDRPTKSHEYLFLLTKSERYYYDADAIREVAIAPVVNGSEPSGAMRSSELETLGLTRATGRTNPSVTHEGGRNARSVWNIATQPYGNVKVPNVGADGQPRTVSPDCPVHGVDDQPQPGHEVALDDAPQADPPNRSPRSDEDRALEPTSGYASTNELRSGTDSSEDRSSSPARTSGSAHASRTPSPRYPAGAPTEAAETADRTSRSSDQSMPPGAAASAGEGAAIRRSEPVSRMNARSSVPDSQGRSTGGHTPDTDAANEAPEGRCSCPEWYQASHFATFPEAIPERCIKAGSKPGDVCMDPFNGSGTTGRVALRLSRRYVGLDLSREYLSEQALARVDPLAAAAQGARNGTSAQGVLGL